MKRILVLQLCLSSLFAYSQEDKTSNNFSDMERNHIRVATPGLFSHDKHLYLHLDSLQEGEYAFPLPGGKVISPYGRNKGKHTGVDIKTHAGDTIRCAFHGIVRMAKSYGAYGKVVVVRHSNGLETVYSHNKTNFLTSSLFCAII